MTNRENYRSIAKRTGYTHMPVDFNMCPSLAKKFGEYCQLHGLEDFRTVVKVPDLPSKMLPLKHL